MTLYSPTRDDVFQMLVALLPRGRAWQTHDTGIQRSESVLQQFLYGMAGPLAEAEAKISALFNEFFCATAAEDIDLWREEYGLPSACDLFGDDVCAKAACLGGSSAEYYQAIATHSGWVTTMRWLKGDDAEFPGVVSTLHVVIDGAQSTAGRNYAYVGTAQCGISHLGVPDVDSLLCGLEKILPAHCAITHEVI